MFGLTFLGDVVIGVGCFGAGVFYNAVARKWLMGAEAYAASLKAKADAVLASLKKKA